MSSELKSLVLELLAPMEGVSARSMFGGSGIFKSGLMFALIAFDELYLKVNDKGEARFIEEGSRQFIYEGKNGKIAKMSYWTLPDRLYDDQEEFLEWAQGAYQSAVEADFLKPPSQRKYKPDFF